ncbi:TetR/AcrR family transcriptional regulator [Hoyosella sp. G463]|uniref:TetR/AcrR family transcriptional regulator n=1 Tax=Lolliginicoccus lacisalsi TaxID=2742202 RepID=A0A927J8X5_9ACTN|nr:TetR/AcrR family transcriptional regulator [Lolliginicoccus lacisalsi]MBD8504878.1 TetR/AcrR family transcriptional regulator [Lolliginicoccus lacisalsi]
MAGPRYDDTEEAILDAARARIMQVGIRRSSMDDIARRAGINRVTIYRKFAKKDSLVEAVLAREIQHLLGELAAIVATNQTVEQRIEDAVLLVLRQTHEHPVVVNLLAVAPEEVLEFVTVRGEQGVALGIEYVVAVLETAQSLSLIDTYDPRPIAELVARLAHSVLLTPRGGLRFDDEQQARHFVRSAIVPLVKHGIHAKESTNEHPRPSPG